MIPADQVYMVCVHRKNLLTHYRNYLISKIYDQMLFPLLPFFCIQRVAVPIVDQKILG